MTTTTTTPTQEAAMIATAPYTVGQAVEIELNDFAAPGFPRRWFPGVVAAVTRDGELFDITVTAPNTTAPGVMGSHVERVNKRGRNRYLRAAV